MSKQETCQQPIMLSDREPFARGGKRNCFVHPEFPDRCVKVPLPGCSAKELRDQASAWKRWRKSVDKFDENINDFKVLNHLESLHSTEVWEHLPKCYGWIETDLGRGLVIELIHDDDGRISRSFLHYLLLNGYDSPARQALRAFTTFWEKHAIPSRDIGLHNMAAQVFSNGTLRLVMIDGFGSTQFLPLAALSRSYARIRARSKIEHLRRDVEDLLEKQAKGFAPGTRGFLLRRS